MPKTKEVREAVEAELADDPLIEAGGITVHTISGDVSLCGTVPSYRQYLEAVDAAWRIAGVTSVRNHLQVALPPESQRDDARLATEANGALAACAAGLEQVKVIAKNGKPAADRHGQVPKAARRRRISGDRAARGTEH